MAEIVTFPDSASLIRRAAEHFVQLSSRAVEESGRFSVALSGGSTPRPLYALLAGESFARRVDWVRVHFFWADERCVPPDDLRSNYRMIRETLFNAIPIKPGHIHRIPGEDDPMHGAAAYEQELRAFFTNREVGFDLVLLGMGEDGHTASLFPGSPAVSEQVRWVMAQYVEAVGMWRITLTPALINASRNVCFLLSGAGKAERLREVLEGPFQPGVLPAQSIRPKRGRVIWLVDEPAARLLKRVE